MSILNGKGPPLKEAHTSSWEPERRVLAARRQLRRCRLQREEAEARLAKWQRRLKVRGPSEKRRRMVAKYTAVLEALGAERSRLIRLRQLAEDLYVTAAARRGKGVPT